MSNPTPVLLLAQHLNAGGSERQLCEIVLSLDRSEFSPHAGCFRPGGFLEEEMRQAGIPVACFPLRSFASTAALSSAFSLTRYISRHGIRLVHAFDVPMEVFAVPLARTAGVEGVLGSQRGHRDLTTGWQLRALRFSDRLVDGIVVNCEALRRHLVEDEGVSAGRVHLCYNGIDTGRFRHTERNEPSHREIVIGSLCMLRPEKSLSTLLRAFSILSPRENGLRLRIIGDGVARQELEALRTGLGLDGICEIEPVTNQVVERLREIDIFVLPSLSEGLSNALMEAMACGCAPVVSRVGGNPELVRHGETGLLFEAGETGALADQLRILAGDADLRRKIGRAASEMIHSRFSRQAAADSMASIYRQFLGGKARYSQPRSQ